MTYGADNLRPIAAIAAIIAVCWLLSEDKRRFPWVAAIGALALQAGLVVLVFALPQSQLWLSGLTAGVDGLTRATEAGAAFVFDYLAGPGDPYQLRAEGQAPFIFAFRVLPLILVISALSAVLWHWGVLKLVIRGFGFVFQRTLGLGGASATAAAANIFMGMLESAMVVRPYLGRLSRSEVFLLMTLGLATVAGSTMAAYAGMLAGVLPNAAGHVVVASVISAPAGILLARIMIPERPGEGGASATYDAEDGYSSTMDALTRGIEEGLAVVFNVAATLLVVVALVALVNMILGAFPSVGGEALSLQRIFGWVFAPLAWAIGAPWSEAATAGNLLGVKLFLTEFVAFDALADTPAAAMSERTRMIMTYALCGFANVGSVGIMAGGLIRLFPEERRAVILELAWKSLVPGFLATLMTASIVASLPMAVFSR